MIQDNFGVNVEAVRTATRFLLVQSGDPTFGESLAGLQVTFTISVGLT